MADRYWRGGSGTWDATSTTNWSATSGGLGGASAPTSADNVFFNSLSNATAYTVTVGTNAVCNDLTATGPASGTVTFSLSATARLECYGSFLLPATGATWTATSGAFLNFRATTSGKTITSNGVLSATNITFDGVGGGWTLGSAIIFGVSNSLNNGSFSTANFNITAGLFATANTTSVKSVNLGSSALSFSNSASINIQNATNLTWNSGTSTINFTGASQTFNGAGQTFYNVNFTNNTVGTTTINGANTFNDLNQTSRSATGTRIVALGANQTVNGTLTLGAVNTSIRRIQVISDIVGTQRTITLNGSLATLADCDFRSIATAGSVGTWTGTRLGNGLGNSGITFTSAKTVYWNLAAGGAWSATGWATTSGGTPDANNFPLGQDTVIIENTGLNTSATITLDALSGWWVGELNASTRSNAMTLASGTSTPRFYKNVTLSSAVTLTGTGAWNFFGQGTAQILDVNTATFEPPITIDSPSGTLQLAENTTCSATVTLTSGTLNLNNNTLTCTVFNSSNTNTRAVAFGTGNITVTGNNAIVYDTNVMTNFSYTGTPTVNFTYSGSIGTRTLRQAATSNGGTESNVVNMNISAGTDIVIIGGSARAYKNLNFTGFTGSCTVNLIGFFGNLTFSSGMTVSGVEGAFFSATSGTQLVTTNGVTLDFSVTQNGVGGTVQLQDNLTMGSTRTYTLTNGSLNLNNLTLSTAIFSSNNANTRSIAFGTGNITLTGNDANIWPNATLTNFSYTGTPTVNCTYSGSTGTRAITSAILASGGVEANAVDFNISAGSDTLNFSTGRNIRNINFTGFSGTVTTLSVNLYGNLTLSSGLTLTATAGATSFLATSGTQQITTAGKTLDFPIILSGTATYQLQDNLTMGAGRALTFTSGTLDTNNNTITGPATLTITGGTVGLADSINIPVVQTSGNVTLFANTSTTTYTLTAGTLNLNGFDLTASTQFSTSNSNVRSINFASQGKIILSGSGTVWGAATATNLTTSGSGGISLTSSSAKTFDGGGASYRTISQDGTGTLTLTGANTFVNIKNTVQPTTVTFPASTTTSVNNFTLSGTAGNLVTINSSIPGTQFTLAQV